MEELPKKFDFIILGTGLGSSLLSGALSRIGKTVLQLDKNDFYGSGMIFRSFIFFFGF